MNPWTSRCAEAYHSQAGIPPRITSRLLCRLPAWTPRLHRTRGEGRDRPGGKTGLGTFATVGFTIRTRG